MQPIHAQRSQGRGGQWLYDCVCGWEVIQFGRDRGNAARSLGRDSSTEEVGDTIRKIGFDVALVTFLILILYVVYESVKRGDHPQPRLLSGEDEGREKLGETLAGLRNYGRSYERLHRQNWHFTKNRMSVVPRTYLAEVRQSRATRTLLWRTKR